jgi:hypothetical protein
MLPVFAKHIRSHNDSLPRIGSPYELLTLRLNDFPLGEERSFEDLQVPMEEMSVHLVGTKDDLRFVNSGEARREELAAAMQRGMALINNPEFGNAFMRLFASLEPAGQ